VFFVHKLNVCEIALLALPFADALYLRRPQLLEGPVTDLGELMTTESYRAASRPLLLTLAWFVFLAGAAFAWAAIETENKTSAGVQPTVLVLKQ
jgi:hypothetical protein